MSDMQEFIAPRPTEYKRIVFRSKSEAIFARNLELVFCDRQMLWEYEPVRFGKVDGWNPDFWVVVQGVKDLGSFLIEYKPSYPTPTYMIELAERFRTLGASTNNFVFLCCGSSFNSVRSVFALSEEWIWEDVSKEVVFLRRIEEASRHRFDLL